MRASTSQKVPSISAILPPSPCPVYRISVHRIVLLHRGSCSTLEGERGTNLVFWLLEVLGIERGTETEGNTSAELDVVSESGDSLIVDLGLLHVLALFIFSAAN